MLVWRYKLWRVNSNERTSEWKTYSQSLPNEQRALGPCLFPIVWHSRTTSISMAFPVRLETDKVGHDRVIGNWKENWECSVVQNKFEGEARGDVQRHRNLRWHKRIPIFRMDFDCHYPVFFTFGDKDSKNFQWQCRIPERSSWFQTAPWSGVCTNWVRTLSLQDHSVPESSVP